MKKIILFFLSLLIPLSLVSCDLFLEKTKIMSRSFHESTSLTYQETTTELDQENLSFMLNQGLPFYFIITSDNCSHCDYFEENFARVIKEEEALCFRIELKEDNYFEFQDIMELLNSTFPDMDHPFGATPVSYLVKNIGECITISYGEMSYEQFKSTFQSLIEVEKNTVFLSSLNEYSLLEEKIENSCFIVGKTIHNALSFYPESTIIKSSKPLYFSLNFEHFSTIYKVTEVDGFLKTEQGKIIQDFEEIIRYLKAYVLGEEKMD